MREDGGIQWGALLLLLTTLILLGYVNAYHENFLFGTIKGYCVVLYCSRVSALKHKVL